jgi:hypothetical protein
MDISCAAIPCPVVLNATCVFYEGETLVYTGINSGDNLQTALQKIDAKFEDAGLGYVFVNGIIQTAPGQPVGLGGSLINDTTIGGEYTLTFAGSLESEAFITTGGTSSQFVKGDGSLDNGSYQPAGNYITALTGDGTATGPGSVPFTLATVNATIGTFGTSTRVPVITVNGKGLVTNITTTLITVPSGVLIFVGDVTGSGVTGSPVTLTLNPVNANIYGSNTFLKFAVNGKGLVTSATPVTSLDIIGALGYTPVPSTRTLSINGISYDLSANRSWSVGTLTSVALTMPVAFTVSGSPLTGAGGTIGVVANGTASQYIKGDGSLGNFYGTGGTAGSSGTSGVAGDRYRTTSTSTFTLGGAGTLTVGTGLAYSVAQSIIVVYNGSNFQECEVISYNALTGVLVFGAPTRTVGSGTYSSWTVNLDGASGGDGSSGSTGSSGSSGSAGSAGTSGTNGTSGSDGSSASSGSSGSSSTSGSTGTSGSDGSSGSSSTSGTTGTSGSDGTSASSGTSALDGTAGTSSTSGSSGTSGSDGTSATSGSSATSGTSALDGTSGSSSTSGTSGSNGTSASSGTSALDGTSGTTGTSGSSASSGSSGTSAADGTAGSSSTSGTSGSSGTSAIDGTSGTSGSGGTSASSGSSSTLGNSVTNGTSGIDGTNGSSATSGSSSTAGSSGTSGSSASSGTSATSGSSGTTGTSGVSGISGGQIYWMNQSINTSSAFGSPTYKQLSPIPSGAVQQTVTTTVPATTTQTLVTFATDTGVPGVTSLPAGNWSFTAHFLTNISNSNWDIYYELWKYTIGGVSTLLGTTNTVPVTLDTVIIQQVYADSFIAAQSLNSTDRLYVNVVAVNTSNQPHDIIFYTEGSSYYSYVQTTFNAPSGSSGTAGTSSTSGTSGSNGTSSTSGSNGTSGTNGTSGSSSTSGTNGTSSTSGTNGTSASSGSSGTSGSGGTSASSGTSALDGTAGTSGSAGMSGTSATAGTSGATGSSGASGTNGTSGSSATSGVNGSAGTSSTSGTNGTSGGNGSSGTSGINGTAGSSATAGTSGATGSSGATGTAGSSGTSSSSGPAGSSGTSSTAGSSGVSGTSGATGSSGATGTSGSSGYASSSARSVQVFTATAGQTTFTVTGGYNLGMVDVFVNGVKFVSGVDFTANDGTTVVMTTGLAAGNIVEIDNQLSAYLPTNALRTVTQFTATAGQTVFTVSYTQGLIDVFYNGSCLAASEYTATNGTSITLTACQLNDIVVVYAYSYAVGAYSGIGGSGTINTIPKFTALSTIGDSAITDNGTTVTLNSRALSGTSATFTGALTAGSSSSQTPVSFSTNSQTNQPALTIFKNVFTGTGENVFRVQSYNSGTSSIIDVFTVKDSGATALSGALSGTSATFSGNLEVFSGSAGVTVGDFLVNPTTKYVYVGRQSSTSGDNTTFVVRDRTGSARATIPGGGSIDTVFSTNNSNFIVSNYSGNSLMTIANTGAATFSSSVTSTGYNVANTGGSIQTVDAGGYISLFGATGSPANTVIIGTASTERMRITSSGRVGIGQTSPGTALSVAGQSENWQLALTSVTGTAGAVIGSPSANVLAFGDWSGNEKMRITSGGDIYFNSGAALFFGLSAVTYISGATSLMTFAVNNAERMRITSGGNVLIGTNTDAGFKLDVNGSGRFSGALTMGAYSYASSAIQFTRAASDLVQPASGNGIMVFAGGNAQMRMNTANQICFDMYNSGNAHTVLTLKQSDNTVSINSPNNNLMLELKYQNVASGYLGASGSALYAYSVNGGYALLNASSVWVPVSDVKRKRNFETYSLGLNAILGLKPKLYNMDFQKDGDDKQLGLVAQEVKEFIPLAFEQNDTFIGLNYNSIIVTMVNAIQELSAKNEDLQSQITELKNK